MNKFKLYSSALIVISSLILSSCGGTAPSQITNSSKSDVADPTPSPTPTKNAYSDSEYVAAKANLRIKKDSVTNDVWMYAKSSPQYVTSNALMTYLYATVPSNPTLRARFQYFGSNWLFIESYIVNVDGEVFNVNPSSVDMKRDNGIIGGDAMVWEYYDFEPTSSDIDMFNAIIKSKSAIIRSTGKYYMDRTITKQEKDALKTILVEYDALKNGIDASKLKPAVSASNNAASNSSSKWYPKGYYQDKTTSGDIAIKDTPSGMSCKNQSVTGCQIMYALTKFDCPDLQVAWKFYSDKNGNDLVDSQITDYTTKANRGILVEGDTNVDFASWNANLKCVR